jgi:RNA polymerase subunit RPABC4/transcription elongation factor Spt4
MPTFKHPCPHCGTFIERDVVACPACGRADPFAPGRCPACSAIVEAGWIACPKCGASLVEPSDEAVADPAPLAPRAAASTPAPDRALPPAPARGQPVSPPTAAQSPAPGATLSCAACGTPLPAGARFCRECGTAIG